MSTDAALIEKRDELKRRLAIGEYKTLVDVVLDQTRQAIQKITHNRQPISTWYIATTLYLLFLLAAFAGLLIIGEYSAFQRQFAPFSRAFIPLSFLVGYFNVMSIIAGNIYIHRVLSVFHDTVIDAIDSVASLDDFERWLDAVCNRKVHFVFSAVGGFFVGMYLVYILNETGINVLLSTAIGTVILNSFSIVFLFLLLYMIALSARLGKYDLKLYSADPASSEAINRLADLLGTFVFLVAIYATLVTLVVATQQMLVQLGALVILLFWLPIIGMFVLTQSSLSSIIQRSKWRTLDGIQSRIEQLHSSEKLGEKETMDTINRLMDYSDRIKSTRTSRIDSRAVLNLINSLLLPLLALVLGNVDKIRGLFK